MISWVEDLRCDNMNYGKELNCNITNIFVQCIASYFPGHHLFFCSLSSSWLWLWWDFLRLIPCSAKDQTRQVQVPAMAFVLWKWMCVCVCVPCACGRASVCACGWLFLGVEWKISTCWKRCDCSCVVLSRSRFAMLHWTKGQHNGMLNVGYWNGNSGWDGGTGGCWRAEKESGGHTPLIKLSAWLHLF